MPWTAESEGLLLSRLTDEEAEAHRQQITDLRLTPLPKALLELLCSRHRNENRDCLVQTRKGSLDTKFLALWELQRFFYKKYFIMPDEVQESYIYRMTMLEK